MREKKFEIWKKKKIRQRLCETERGENGKKMREEKGVIKYIMN